MKQCKNKATWILIDGYSPDDYTYSCDEHLEEMKSLSSIESFRNDNENLQCCFMSEK